MITEIDFKVKGEERKKLAYAIGELLGMPVKYTRTPKFDYLIGSNVLDKNGVFHASEDMTESKLESVLERFYKGEPIQQSEQREDETEEADVLSISVPRNMFTDGKLENLQKLIEGKVCCSPDILSCIHAVTTIRGIQLTGFFFIAIINFAAFT